MTGDGDKGGLRYDRMVETAMRGVVRQALLEVMENGLPGNHHFYITYRTDYPGVAIPDHLRMQYPETMTIVLQHQFWGLEIHDDRFEVTLSFRKVHERLVVPFESVVGFADPTVNFALQFDSISEDGQGADFGGSLPAPAGDVVSLTDAGAPRTDADQDVEAAEPEEQDEGDKPSAEVVTLDSFRKK